MSIRTRSMKACLAAVGVLAASVPAVSVAETVTSLGGWGGTYQKGYMREESWNPNGTPVVGNDYVISSGDFMTVSAGYDDSWYTFNGDSLTWKGGNFVLMGPKLDLSGIVDPRGLVIQAPNPSLELNMRCNYARYDGGLPVAEVRGPITVGSKILFYLRNPNHQVTFKSSISSVPDTTPQIRLFCESQAGATVTNDFVAFAGDLSAYYGDFEVRGGGFPIAVKFGPAAVINGTLTMNDGRNGVLQTLDTTGDMSVANLVLNADTVVKAELDIVNSANGCIRARTATVTAPVHIQVKPLQDPFTNPMPERRFAVLSVTEGDLSAADFDLEVPDASEGVAALFSLEVEGSTLYVRKANVDSPIRPIVAATWTGAGADASVRTAENWKEGLPSLSSGETLATFAESGVEAVVTDRVNFNGFDFTAAAFTLRGEGADAAVRLYAQGMKVADGATATVAVPVEPFGNQAWQLGAGSTLQLRAPILGNALNAPYQLLVTNGTFDIAASGSTFLGEEKFVDVAVNVSGEEPFGAGNATVTFRGSKKANFGNLTTSRKIDYGVSMSQSPSVAEGARAVFKSEFNANVANFQVFVGKDAQMVFDGPFKCSWMAPTCGAGAEIVYNGPVAGGTIQTDVPMTFASTGNSLSGYQGLCMLYSGGKVLKFGADDAFLPATRGKEVALTMTGVGNIIDLCGHSQTVGCVTMMHKNDKDLATANTSKIRNTGDPATLHVVQMKEEINTGFPKAWIGGDITGPISLWKDGSARLCVTNKVTAVGEIKVTEGLLEFPAGASWLGATNLTVSGSTASVKVADGRQLDKRVAMAFADGGTIEIPVGVQVRALSATVDGQPLAMGVWKHGESYDASKQETPAIAGDGSLFVGPSGLLMIVR